MASFLSYYFRGCSEVRWSQKPPVVFLGCASAVIAITGKAASLLYSQLQLASWTLSWLLLTAHAKYVTPPAIGPGTQTKPSEAACAMDINMTPG